MNVMESFNKTLEYIETVLDGEMDERKISFLSGYSFPVFRRMFSVLTGQTLAEYMRYRKLTQAAVDLREMDLRVIDIALKYGYESADSFGMAFKNYHGHTPFEVRNGKAFKVLSKIQLALSIQGGRNMNVVIQKKGRFCVAGVNARDIETTSCPDVWDELYTRYSHKELSALGSGQSFGICHDVKNTNKINYLAACGVTNEAQAREMGLELMAVEEAEYAVVELKGKVPDCIHEG